MNQTSTELLGPLPQDHASSPLVVVVVSLRIEENDSDSEDEEVVVGVD